MIRRTVSIVSAGLLAATVFAGTAGATDPPPAATGTVSCRLVGRVTFSTPLATGGTTATTATFVGKANGCTGTDGGATVRSGRVTLSAAMATNDCAALSSISMDGTVAWKTKAGAAAIADTTISVGSLVADPASLMKPKYSATGSASAGSFAVASLTSTMSVSQSITAIGKQCEGARLRSLTVRASQSDLVIGTPAPPA